MTTAGLRRHRDRIAVVGGGIGGLAAAAFLRRAGLAATVYEQASALGEVGAGLVVAPNAARLLRRLPSEFGLERAGVVLETGWEFRRWADGSVLFAQKLGEACARRYGEHTWTMHLVHYPVSGGRLVNIVAFSPARAGEVESWSAVGRVADLAAEFAGWDPRLGKLIAAAERVGRWSVLDRAPLPRWVNGRIALLGDAAHPMLPFYAQGAGQAIEDAAALAVCLTTGPSEPPAALARYEGVRLPRASRVQEASRDRTAHHHLPDGPEQVARDAAFAGEDPLSHNDWLYGYDAEQAAAAATPAG